MKKLNDYRMSLTLSIFAVVIVFYGGSVKAEFIFTEPVSIGGVVNTASHEEGPCISADGLSLYFTRRDSSSSRLMVARRPHTNSYWRTCQTIELPCDRTDVTFTDPSLSEDGLSMYLTGHEPEINASIWMTQRDNINSAWNEPVMLDDSVNASSFVADPSISADNLELFFTMNAILSNDQLIVPCSGKHIWMSQRTSVNDLWSAPFLAFMADNYSHFCPCISSDGLTLLFSEGINTLYITRRTEASQFFPFENPVKLPEPVNYENDLDTTTNTHPCLSHDGRKLYFVSGSPSGYHGYDICITNSVPVVDFNDDENVDMNDLLILMDNWNTNESLCDIAPAPFGDGKVDMNDLEVFIEYWEMENFFKFPDVHVDAGDSGQITLEQGQRLVITLEANPSTGYSWEMVEDPNSILEQVGEAEFVSSVEGGEIVGAGGWQNLRFKAINSGQMTLTLLYRRPWEPEAEPISVFSFAINVN